MDEQSQKLEILEENYDRLFKASEGIQAERDRIQAQLAECIKSHQKQNAECERLQEDYDTLAFRLKEVKKENQELQAEVERLVRDLTKERETIILLDYLRQGSVGEVWAHYEQQLAEQRAEIDRLQAEVEELRGYKAHHKTCLELAEEVNREIDLERRINSALRAEVERWKSEGIKCEEELRQQLAELRTENERPMTNEEMLRMQSDSHEQAMREQRTIIDGLVEALKNTIPWIDAGELDRSLLDRANAALEAVEKVNHER